jgi:hypothetical protein
MRKRKWTPDQLLSAVSTSSSVRQVLAKLGLRQAGGNYNQIQKYFVEQSINTAHFRGKGWSRGLKIAFHPKQELDELLVKHSGFQSHKLKIRLFASGIKKRQCEECGWAKTSADGRIPLELDHVNGNRFDNRIDNLRILCPNCHSLKPTHRGRNIGRK